MVGISHGLNSRDYKRSQYWRNMIQRWEVVAGVWTLPLTSQLFWVQPQIWPQNPPRVALTPTCRCCKGPAHGRLTQISRSFWCHTKWTGTYFDFNIISLLFVFTLSHCKWHSFFNPSFPLLEFFPLKIENRKLTEETKSNNMFWDKNAQFCEKSRISWDQGEMTGMFPQSFQR